MATADPNARTSGEQALVLGDLSRIPGSKLKDAALADDDLLRQGFRYDVLALKKSCGDGSPRSNGGMHLVSWSSRLARDTEDFEPADDGYSLVQYRASVSGSSDRVARVP